MKRLVLSVICVAAAAISSAAEASYKSMWLTESVSGRTIGPVVNKPGNTFEAAGKTWVVMSARPGEVDFADIGTMKREGPYGLVEQRYFDLGDTAFVFTKIEDFEGDDPSRNDAVVTQARRAPAQRASTPWGEDLPERWILEPVPSTNPGAHKDPIKTWQLVRRETLPTVTGWIEPIHADKYDWSLGEFSAKSSDAFKSFRLGATGTWNGFFGDAGLIASGKSGTIVSDSTSLSNLKVDGGRGLFLRAGYDFGMVIDGPWSASVAGFGTWQRVSVDVSARATMEKKVLSTAIDEDGSQVSAWERSYGFNDWESGSTLTEMRLTAAAGINYDEWYWGGHFRAMFDCWSDVDIDADVPVLSSVYSLGAERSKPVGIEFGGWYSPDDFYVIEGSLVVASETTLRLGFGIFF